MRSLRKWISLIGVLLLTACDGGSGSGGSDTETTPTPPAPVLSVSAYYYTDPPAASDMEWFVRYLQAFALARDAGATGQFQSYRWSELEPHVGQYNQAKLSEFASTMQSAQQNGLTQLLGIQIINTVKREVPAELATTAWNDPAMINALRNLFNQLLPHMHGRVHYLSIGNEVDPYFFNGRMNEMPAYAELFSTVRTHLRPHMPTLNVGITVTAGGWLGSNVQSLLDLQQNADVMITTYYPLNADFSVQPPTAPAADFPALLQLAGNKPLVLQEVGYPSATLLGSSEAAQAEFIHQVFAAWRDSDGRVPFLNLFLLHDFASALVDELVIYYGSNNTNFRAYLDTLGLRHRNNSDKPAWQAVRSEMNTD